MNTSDQAPKNGDFVAYIEELERRQLRAHQPSAPAGTPSGVEEIKPDPVATANATTLASGKAVTPGVQSSSVGLIAIGLVLVIAGMLLQGGIFLIAFGIFLLWQALRVIRRNARATAQGTRTQAMQEVARLLSARAERKGRQRK
ncbi:MAG TPA: hypothetical protein VMG60_06735 [Burkholderiaceae bacterium]|nr:hypothetical protein [Burkholderiaceae bacterium]